ncbi:MAG TPA: DUF2127 domain-containing protein [Burkholderiaceae bacterium]|nr:DUF2127 domain-containing protein [Burkholderiaceae bacterium]
MESVTADSGTSGAQRRALRAIAAFEAIKGAVALAAGLGFLSLLHHDLHRLAASLIGHIGLDPGARYPAIALHDVDQLLGVNHRALMLAITGYVLVRWWEAFGLWNGRAWGEWLGAMSGALYVPFEMRHMVHHPTLATAVVMAANVAVVSFLSWQLWRRRRTPVA